MGERLEIASLVTPTGSTCAIAFATALYFFGRWISTIEGTRASFGLGNPGFLSVRSPLGACKGRGLSCVGVR
jgi:hypothetical protein